MLSQMREIEYKSCINRIGWALVIMIGAMNTIGVLNDVINAVWASMGSDKVSIALGSIVDSVCYLSYFLLPSWLFYVMSQKKKTEPIKFSPKFSKYLPLMIIAGIGVAFGAAVVNDWFCTLIGYSLPDDSIPYYISNPELIALYMTLSLAPAFGEELFFRGVIYTNLRPYGKTAAILISALAFGLMHQNVGQFLYTTVAGICLALIYEETGSIWGCIFMHMFNNLFSVFATSVLYRYPEAQAAMIVYLVQAVMIFAGAICLVMLICLKKREKNAMAEREAVQLPQGFFGSHRRDCCETQASADNVSLTLPQACKIALKTPGIICFVILAVLTMLFMILLSMLYSGGVV